MNPDNTDTAARNAWPQESRPAPGLAILAYMNRSGSTFLATELDRLKDVRVTLEARFPFNRHPERNLCSSEEVETYVDSLFEDSKFCRWGLSRQCVKEILQSVPYPLGFKNILETVAPLAFCQEREKVIVYKSGRLPFRRGFRNEFKGVPVIFIDRDPRAIFASQKSSFTSSTKQRMERDIVRFALSYRAIHDVLNEHGRDWQIVRYEDFVVGTDNEIERIARYLGVDCRTRVDSEYARRIPPEQAYLHPNITKPPDVSRVSVWKEKLSCLEVRFLQTTLKHDIVRSGYRLEPEHRLSTSEQLVICIWWARFACGRFRKRCALAARRWIR